jgi:hypothetical protein
LPEAEPEDEEEEEMEEDEDLAKAVPCRPDGRSPTVAPLSPQNIEAKTPNISTALLPRLASRERMVSDL